jgi:hypothetical protein
VFRLHAPAAAVSAPALISRLLSRPGPTELLSRLNLHNHDHHHKPPPLLLLKKTPTFAGSAQDPIGNHTRSCFTLLLFYSLVRTDAPVSPSFSDSPLICRPVFRYPSGRLTGTPYTACRKRIIITCPVCAFGERSCTVHLHEEPGLYNNRVGANSALRPCSHSRLHAALALTN